MLRPHLSLPAWVVGQGPAPWPCRSPVVSSVRHLPDRRGGAGELALRSGAI